MSTPCAEEWWWELRTRRWQQANSQDTPSCDGDRRVACQPQAFIGTAVGRATPQRHECDLKVLFCIRKNILAFLFYYYFLPLNKHSAALVMNGCIHRGAATNQQFGAGAKPRLLRKGISPRIGQKYEGAWLGAESITRVERRAV